MRGKNRSGNRRPHWWAGRRVRRVALVVVATLLVVNFWVASRMLAPAPLMRVPYSPTFLGQVSAGNVTQITSTGNSLQGALRRPLRYPADSRAAARTGFSTELPSFANANELEHLLESRGVIINARPASAGPSLLASLVFGFGPTLLLLLLLFTVVRRLSAMGGGGAIAFGRSRARRFERTSEAVTFDDVAGIDEAKAELSEIVDFLRNPDKYARLGGRIPRGVLLSGQPGTGKTLLARAVAGQAGVPFFQMSASEFVEMIVGVGASRVRDLFRQAREAAPAIIFVDELDAVGRSRSSAGPSISGGHDEREQTLNQILTEMDGFDARAEVIVLGATNRPETLDPALLRPGRFDRRVMVQPPDRAGREAILRVHTRSVPLAPEVDLAALAASTPGMVGADLANLVNEAALIAARRNHPSVTPQDLTDSLERIILGAERKLVLSLEDRRRTAYHEAGHAIIGMLTPEADPVRKVSIIPRGQALGVTFSAPDNDRVSFDERYLLAQIKVALGGRVAEELVFGDRTTAAESDIQQLTRIARLMVGRWGMSPMGPLALLPAEGVSPLLPGASESSPETLRQVDAEVAQIVEDATGEVHAALSLFRANLDLLVEALMNHETLDEAEAYAAAGLPRSPNPIEPIVSAAPEGL